MKRYLRLYRAFLNQHLKTLLEYRANFLIATGGAFIFQGAYILAVWVVMDRAPALNGWTRTEVYLVYGLLTIALSLKRMFGNNLFYLGQGYVRPGRLDALLVRPVNPLFHLLADRFNPEGCGDFLLGLLLVGYACRTLGIGITAGKVLFLVAVLTSGAVIAGALDLLAATLAFWVVVATPFNLTLGHTAQFAQYPLTIYKRPVQLLFTWLLPYGLASFYPAQYLLGRDHGLTALLSVPMAALLALVAYRFWQTGLRRYTSAGS